MLMNKKRRLQRSATRSIRYLCLALGVTTLAACAERTEFWSPPLSPKQNQVSWAEYHHPVSFSKTSAEIDKAEKEALARFLRRVARGEGVRVMLATGSVNPPPLTKRRETSLASHLIEKGFSVLRIQAKRTHTRLPNTVGVTVGRYIVKTPTCPDWSKEASGDPANRVTSNFRCANETNLGLMVANPEALIRGTDIGPADGEAIILGIGKYRRGEIEIPKATSARESKGGGGGGL